MVYGIFISLCEDLRFVVVVWFATLVVTSWLVATSGLSAVMHWLAVSVVGLAVPGILLPVYILLPVLRSYFGFPALVTWLPWRRTVLHSDGSRRVSERFPGAPERNPTCQIGRCNIRYGLDLSPFLQPEIIDELLTNLGKFAKTAEASKWLFTVTASLKTLEFLRGYEGIDRGNLTLTVGILSVKSKNYNLTNAVFIVNVKLSRK